MEEKYHSAGGSARFMFDTELCNLKQNLLERMGKLSPEEWESFAIDSVSASTSQAVNSLMQLFTDNNGSPRAAPVSKYVLSVLMTRRNKNL